jgi:hypothetical protein
MVSGSSGPLTEAEVRELGIRELLSMPLSYAELARVLAQVLGDGRAAPGSSVATSG